MDTPQLRIALVCPHDWCVDGGVRSHMIRELAERFRAWGHRVAAREALDYYLRIHDEYHQVEEWRVSPARKVAG